MQFAIQGPIIAGFVGAAEDVDDAEPAWVAGLRADIANGNAKSFNSSAHAGPHVLEALRTPVLPYAAPGWFPADVNAFFAMTAAHADDLVEFYGLHPALLPAVATPEAVLASKRAAIAAYIGFRGA